MRVLKSEGPAVTALTFSPNGKLLAAGSSSRVDVWDVAAGTVDGWRMPIWGMPPDNVRFDPSGKRLLVGLGLQRGLYLIDVRTWDINQVGTFDANCLAVSPAGRVLVGGGRIGAFELTKKGLGAREWAKSLGGNLLAGLDFYPGGDQFATVETQHVPGTASDTRAVVRVREATDGGVTRTAECDCKQGGLVRVSPDGEWIAFASKRFLIVHHGVELTRSFKVPSPTKKQITGIAFHPSGRYLAETGGDGTVRFRDRDDGWAVTRTFNGEIGGLKSVAFNPKGTLVAAGGGKRQVVVWDVEL